MILTIRGFIMNAIQKNVYGFYQRPSDVWLSERGCQLITQPYAIIGAGVPILTVERYCKWYSLYYIPCIPDKVTQPIRLIDAKDLPYFDGWLDHCPRPKELVDYCIKHGIKMEFQVYYAIATRWANDGSGPGMLYTSDFGHVDNRDDSPDNDKVREAFKHYNLDDYHLIDYPLKYKIEDVLYDPGEFSLIN